MVDSLARFAGLPAAVRLLIAALAGAVGALGQAPFGIWPATLAALAIAMLIHASARNARQAALMAWGFGVGYFGLALHWIVEPFLVDIGRHGWMAPFALILMAGGAALFWALAAYLAARTRPGSALLFGLALVWAEITRSLIFTGFPWALLGHVWIGTDMAQWAAFGGPHLLSLITAISAWALVLLYRRRWLAGGGLVLALLVAGFALRAPMTETAEDAPVIRLVQPNAPQHQKWDPAFRQLFMDRMVVMTAAKEVPDLVVWPETAIPSLLNYIEADMQPLADAARGAPLVFGIQRRDDIGRFFNSLVVMDGVGDVHALYDKQHLVPFGEYIPGGAVAERLGLRGLAAQMGGFTPGHAPGPVDLPGIGQAVPLICYEGIFAEEITRGDDLQLLLLITNDAWFGRAAGPYQHLAQARLRAIEQGLPMVRVANTGVSAMIDPWGQIVAELPLGVDGFIDVPLPAPRPETYYARWGDGPVFGLMTLLTLLCFAVARRNSD